MEILSISLIMAIILIVAFVGVGLVIMRILKSGAPSMTKNYFIPAIIWIVASIIWIGLAITRIVNSASPVMIMINVLVAVLSVTNAIISIVRYKNSK